MLSKNSCSSRFKKIIKKLIGVPELIGLDCLPSGLLKRFGRELVWIWRTCSGNS
jgi:hypothetical protein